MQYQLPNEHSRVGFLLEAIQYSDPGLQAAMASNKTEGMRNNFEASAAHLLSYDPAAKKRSIGYKRDSTQISSSMEASDDTTKKPSIGKTGLHLCFHKNSECRTLDQEQKDELREWRANNPNSPKSGAKKPRNEPSKKPKSFMKKQVASLVEAELKRAAKSEAQESNEEQYIMSMVEAAVTKTLNQQSDPKPQAKPKVTLQAIIKNAKNHGSSWLHLVISTLTTN